MRRKALGIVAVIALMGALQAGTFDKKPSRYFLDAKIDWASKSIRCRMSLEFFNGSGEVLDKLYFTVYGNKKYSQKEKYLMELASNYFKVRVFPRGFEENRTDIEKVCQEGALACQSQFVREDGTLLEVCLAKPVEPDSWGKLEIFFTLHLANMRGFLGWMDDTMMLAYWYPVLNVHDEDGWHNNPMTLYHEPFYTDAAYYKASFQLDEGLVIAAPGLVEDKVEDGKRCVKVDGGLLREFTCAISRNYAVFRQERDGFVIESYCSPEDSYYGQIAAQFAGEALSYYEKHFGPYPDKTARKFVVAQVHTPWLGTEFSGIIFMDRRAYRLPHILIRHFDFLISHETAHQWWHYLVGNDQYREEWLDEAFASYSQQLYLEDKYGLGDNYYVLPKGLGFLPTTSFRKAREVRYLAQARRGMDEEILKPIDSFKYLENVFAMPYDKGMFVLDMLKKRVGDEKFFAIMREYASRFSYKNASVEDFITVAEEVSGENLEEFFYDWLRTDKKCDYALEYVKSSRVGDKYKNEIGVVNKGEITAEVDVDVELGDGRKQSFKLEGREEERIIFESDAPVEKVVVDPEKKLLDVDRTNNVSPHPVKFKASPYYAAIYDIPLFVPPDEYYVLFGVPINFFNTGLHLEGRKLYEHKEFIDGRYDFHHKVYRKQAGFEIDGAFSPQGTLRTMIFHDNPEGRGESGKGIRVEWERTLGFDIPAMEPLENSLTLFFERSRRRDVGYLHDDALFGATFKLDTRAPAWDPDKGFKSIFTLARSEKIFGAGDEYTLAQADIRGYQSLPFFDGKLAGRLMCGYTTPLHEDEFYLGGPQGLRGFHEGEFDGGRVLVGSLELRVPFAEVHNSFAWNLLTLEGVEGVLFFDAGKVWDDDWDEGVSKSDVGVGARFDMGLFGVFDRFMLRVDIAFPTGEYSSPQLWIALNHAF